MKKLISSILKKIIKVTIIFLGKATIALVGFGVGLSWGVTLLTWTET
jgi:hypothetical protein